MSEDMTYQPVSTLADLRNQVAELERQLAQDDSNMVALAARNAELAAWIDAIPTGALFDYYYGSEADDGDGRNAEPTVREWIMRIQKEIAHGVFPQLDEVQP